MSAIERLTVVCVSMMAIIIGIELGIMIGIATEITIGTAILIFKLGSVKHVSYHSTEAKMQTDARYTGDYRKWINWVLFYRATLEQFETEILYICKGVRLYFIPRPRTPPNKGTRRRIRLVVAFIGYLSYSLSSDGI
jgi:hypothetical protein